MSENNITRKQLDILKNKPLEKFSLRKKTYKMVKKLKNQYNIFLLSNVGPIDFIAINEWLNIRKIFKKCYLSYEHHLLKPSLEIYKDAEKYFDINPNETLFLDDKIENIIGAEKCGWNTIHVKSEGQLIERLQEKVLIKLPINLINQRN